MNITKELVNNYCPRPEKRLDTKEYYYSYDCYLKTANTLKKVIDDNIFRDESLNQFTKMLDEMLAKNKVKRYQNFYFNTFENELFAKLKHHSLTKAQLKKLNRKLKLITLQYKINNSFQANPTID